MTWRIVNVSSNSKLELKLNYMVVRNGSETLKVYLPEIAVLILESTAISMTASLLCELTRQGVKIVLCDEKRNPYGEIMPYYGTRDVVEKNRVQSSWDDVIKKRVWSAIIANKIAKQRDVLRRCGHLKESELLTQYIDEIKPGDSTNREGHAAKVYFNVLFDDEFSRRDDNAINSALDYGYTLILSAVNRSISAFGYSTMIGIFHDNCGNPFNLGCDLMEPFRPLIDEYVLSLNPNSFGTEEKHKMIDVLNTIVSIEGKQNYLLNAIRIFVQSFFSAMDKGDISKLSFYEVTGDEGAVYESDCVL